MIFTEALTINGKEYKRTYSDAGVYIERDGERYEEAIDPLDTGRVYTETEEEIADESEAEEADYLASLERFGVE